jgi:hypothetical protein
MALLHMGTPRNRQHWRRIPRADSHLVENRRWKRTRLELNLSQLIAPNGHARSFEPAAPVQGRDMGAAGTR